MPLALTRCPCPSPGINQSPRHKPRRQQLTTSADRCAGRHAMQPPAVQMPAHRIKSAGSHRLRCLQRHRLAQRLSGLSSAACPDSRSLTPPLTETLLQATLPCPAAASAGRSTLQAYPSADPIEPTTSYYKSVGTGSDSRTTSDPQPWPAQWSESLAAARWLPEVRSRVRQRLPNLTAGHPGSGSRPACTRACDGPATRPDGVPLSRVRRITG